MIRPSRASLPGPFFRAPETAFGFGSLDHLVATEHIDIGRGVAEDGEDLVRVLAELWRGGAHRDGARRHPDRRADVGYAAELRVIGVDHHLAVQHLGIGEELLVGVDGPAGHTRVVQGLHPVRGRRGREHCRQLALEDGAMAPAVGAAAEARVFDPLRVPEGLGTALPDTLAGRAQHQIAVLGLEALVGRVLAMARALARGLLVIYQPARARPRGKTHRRLEERALDLLPFARALAP